MLGGNCHSTRPTDLGKEPSTQSVTTRIFHNPLRTGLGRDGCQVGDRSESCRKRSQTKSDSAAATHVRRGGRGRLPGRNGHLDAISAARYYSAIQTFADNETERLFYREPVKSFSPPVRRPGLRKLLLLDAAESLDDLRVPPGNRLERLRGNRKGQHSIRINDQSRVCFRWEAGDAYEVEIVDYH